MFNIGWPELILLGIVALVVLGPRDLVQMMRQAGVWMRQIQQMAHEFSWALNRAVPPQDSPPHGEARIMPPPPAPATPPPPADDRAG